MDDHCGSILESLSLTMSTCHTSAQWLLDLFKVRIPQTNVNQIQRQTAFSFNTNTSHCGGGMQIRGQIHIYNYAEV